MKRKSEQTTVTATTKLTSVGIWSLAYTSFVYAFVLGVIWNGVVFVLWKLLTAADAIGKLDEKIVMVAGDGSFQLSEHITQGRVLGVSAVLTVTLVAATPLLAIVLGGIYSAIATWTGGVRINLTSKILPDVAPAVAKALEEQAFRAEEEPPGRPLFADDISQPEVKPEEAIFHEEAEKQKADPVNDATQAALPPVSEEDEEQAK